MSIYKILKISILLGTGILVACSPDKSEIQQSSEKQSQTQSLRVYSDPKTGEYLQSPPPVIQNSNQSNLANSISTTTTQPTTKKYSDLKESTIPGGGTYIELDMPVLNEKAKNIKK